MPRCNDFGGGTCECVLPGLRRRSWALHLLVERQQVRQTELKQLNSFGRSFRPAEAGNGYHTTTAVGVFVYFWDAVTEGKVFCYQTYIKGTLSNNVITATLFFDIIRTGGSGGYTKFRNLFFDFERLVWLLHSFIFLIFIIFSTFLTISTAAGDARLVCLRTIFQRVKPKIDQLWFPRDLTARPTRSRFEYSLLFLFIGWLFTSLSQNANIIQPIQPLLDGPHLGLLLKTGDCSRQQRLSAHRRTAEAVKKRSEKGIRADQK